jgi:hypothetical protein
MRLVHGLFAGLHRRGRFPWGDCPAPWVNGYCTIYDTGIDDSVFMLDECILTSLTSDDDPP